ncbi:branched-chain amino acid aminotransferase [Bacillus sp. T33-2]|uniref:branched-chain amino acid aminotransferase n=1 Tax=Bacillus sp. T33-2 TaxID=2054168 RepID=UPI000C75A75B|nr:branched-chain amino acid aminotransferase [Bacillus sp. T33-2]PLR91150.1 branched-chain amino acid aminotransferase [Bacillus sp. T33-2]
MTEQNHALRFKDAYIERCDKETEQVLANEDSAFLNESIRYFKKHMNEFIYLESELFDQIGVDAVSLEVDDVFGNYDVMLGLKLQKKLEQMLMSYLKTHLPGEDTNFDLIFDHDEGLWNLNFALDQVKGFNDGMSVGEAYNLIFSFLSDMVQSIKK